MSGEVHACRKGSADKAGCVFSTRATRSRARRGRFAFGDEHPVVGRSLQLFILEPTHTNGQSSAPERSYQHVMQSFDEALAQSLSMPAPKTGEAPPK